ARLPPAHPETSRRLESLRRECEVPQCPDLPVGGHAVCHARPASDRGGSTHPPQPIASRTRSRNRRYTDRRHAGVERTTHSGSGPEVPPTARSPATSSSCANGAPVLSSTVS